MGASSWEIRPGFGAEQAEAGPSLDNGEEQTAACKGCQVCIGIVFILLRGRGDGGLVGQ